MKKRWLSLLLAGMMLLSCFAAVQAEESKEELQKVEITFSIGDSQISVNGEMVEYVAPYVVNDTTLVPVRLITESFGADVGWNEELQQATVTYGGVEIILTIGSKVAQVNGDDVELLTAPEVTNDRTMLPLRFITETFGADVGWEEETQRVTVVKEITNSNSIKDYAMILKRSDKEYVGDSYSDWSIKRTSEYQLSDRSFDGYENYFVSGSREASFEVGFFEKEEDDTVENVYKFYKEYGSEYSVMALEKKKTSSGTEYVYFQAKGSKNYIVDRIYFGEDKVYYVYGNMGLEEGLQEFNAFSDMLDTFDLDFDSQKTEDLSDVNENGMRMFQSKDMEVSVLIPGDFKESSAMNDTNEFRFYKNVSDTTYADFAVCVYSNEEGNTYLDWAKHDRENNAKLLNPDYFSFSELKETTVSGLPAVYYTNDLKGDVTIYSWDIFIDAGDYFYNISYDIPGTLEEAEQKSKMIQESIQIGTIDKEKIGRMIRITSANEITYKEFTDSKYSYKISLPEDWEIAQGDGAVTGMDSNGIRCFMMMTSDLGKEKVTTKELAELFLEQQKKQDDIELIDTTLKEFIVDGTQGFSFSFYEISESGEKLRIRRVMVVKDNIAYVCVYYCPDKYYGEESQEIETEILKSIDLK